MKFLADMGISPKTVAFLHALGHDAVHLSDEGLERLPDPDIVAKARHEKRILLVHDLGFGEVGRCDWCGVAKCNYLSPPQHASGPRE